MLRSLRGFTTAVAVSLAFIPCIFSDVHASQITYNFDNPRFGQWIDPTQGTTGFRLSSLGTAASQIVFNTDNGVTGNARLTLDGTGVIRETDLANGRTAGAVLDNDVSFFLDINFENVLAINDPEGIIGFKGINASSIGTITIENFDYTGDGQDDVISYDLTTKFMDFARYADTDHLYSELAGLGEANLFVWQSLIAQDLLGKAWTTSVGNFMVNGVASNDFVKAFGDVHNFNGSVPEPATCALLGLGLLGGALRKKKQEEAA